VSEETVSTDEPRKKESVATQTPGRTVKNSKSQQDSTTPTQIPVSLLLSLGQVTCCILNIYKLNGDCHQSQQSLDILD
jgi:hypothetical protein